jgi:protein-S-isoprenylcysteine O-methyltransferase Ste14
VAQLELGLESLRAPLAGLAFLLTFLWILRRRIAVEERALNDAAPSR